MHYHPNFIYWPLIGLFYWDGPLCIEDKLVESRTFIPGLNPRVNAVDVKAEDSSSK